jgi:hypothetical protein
MFDLEEALGQETSAESSIKEDVPRNRKSLERVHLAIILADILKRIEDEDIAEIDRMERERGRRTKDFVPTY